MSARAAGPAAAPAVSAPAVSYVVFDIDGVLADVSHRLHHLAAKPKNWPAFFADAAADPPLGEGVSLAQALAGEHRLVYLTGRPARLRDVTEAWLVQHGLPRGPVMMRRSGDYRPARTTKLEVVRQLAAEHPVHVVIDDDPAVIQALHDAGFAAMHATWAPREAVLHQAQESDGRT